MAGHWKFYVITACWKVNSSQLLLLQKMGDSQKSIGTVQKPSFRLWWNVTHPRTRRESDLNIFDAVGASIGWRRGDGGFQGVELHPWRGKLTISRARGVSLAETIGRPIWTLRCWETLAKVHRNAQVLILVASARTGKKRSNHVTMSAFFLVSRTKEVHFKETKLVKWTINPSLETQFSMEFGFISKTICSWLLDVLSVMNLRGSRVHYILSFFWETLLLPFARPNITSVQYLEVKAVYQHQHHWLSLSLATEYLVWHTPKNTQSLGCGSGIFRRENDGDAKVFPAFSSVLFQILDPWDFGNFNAPQLMFEGSVWPVLRSFVENPWAFELNHIRTYCRFTQKPGIEDLNQNLQKQKIHSARIQHNHTKSTKAQHQLKNEGEFP